MYPGCLLTITCPVTRLSDNGLQVGSKISRAVYQCLGMNKMTTSSYHPSTNGGIEYINHAMAQIIAVGASEQ